MIFGKLPLTVIQFPSGRYGFVGSIPTALGAEVPATRSDVMGGRSHRNSVGELVTWKFPSFDTEAEAVGFAAAAGYPAKAPVAAS